MRLFLQKTLFILLLGLTLQACETLQNFKFTDSDDKYADWDAKQFYDNARKAMDAENYFKAIKLYETLEVRYPFGDYATQAQLDVAYAYFKNGKPEVAIVVVDQFIKIHPRNPNVDYAYYLKGLINFNLGIGFIGRFLPTDSTQRDPGNAQETYDNFQALVNRFPDSQYTPDAKQRMLSLKNNLAMYEIHVARFYMKRKAYISAANRANYVIKEYQRTPAVPYALQIMQTAYTKLGLDDLSANVDRITQENFPNGYEVLRDQDISVAKQVWNFIGFDQ